VHPLIIESTPTLLGNFCVISSMKRLWLILSTLFLFLFNALYSQHTLTLLHESYSPDGVIAYRGKASIIEDSKSIKLNTSSSDYRYFHFSIIKDVIDKNGNKIWTQEEYQAKLFKIVCKNNSESSVIILPFKDDFYGLRTNVESYYDSLCFIVSDHIKVMEYLDNNKLELEKINEYHLSQMIEYFNVDYIIHGYTYRVDVPYRFSSTSVDPTTVLLYSDYGDYTSVVNGLLSLFYIDAENKARSNAIIKSGSYVNLTLYSFDKKSKIKKFIILNKPILKVG